MDKYATRWGHKEIVYLTKELGFRPISPTVSIALFENTFGKAYRMKAKGPKIIMKGLNLLDAFVDTEGIYLPGKTTLVINSSDIDNLFLIAGILNSSYAIFYIKTKYSSSSYCGGITFTKDMIDSLPLPSFSERERECLIQLSKKATELRAANPSAYINPILKEIDLRLFKSLRLTYDEIQAIDPETEITCEEYVYFNLE